MKTDLRSYLAVLKAAGLVIKSELYSDAAAQVTGVTYDSRAVRSGFIFICKGAAFKKEYLLSAVKLGAVCYISEADYGVDIPHIIVSDIREAMPHTARLFYDIPKSFNVIGITGTKGKTTTAYYIKAIFDEALKRESAFITTVETFDGRERINTGITTPESLELYRHFKNAYESGLNQITIEASSQALKYKRTDGIEFDSAVFLNISEDHISPIEHPDFEDYFTSKLKIFSQCRTAFICADTDKLDRVLRAAKDVDTVTFGLTDKADIYAFGIRAEGAKSSFCVRYNNADYEFVLNMRGVFNIENALAAIAVAFKYNLPYEAIYKALEGIAVPGRGEEYASGDGKINVIVDYAHNGLSFRNIISAARQQWPDKKIITVFGCPGGKGLNRRADMGRAAGELSDYIYLTADDPANEDVNAICNQIAEAIGDACPYRVIPDRGEAVEEAIRSCAEPSVVLLLGKGTEAAQKIGNRAVAYETDAYWAKKTLNGIY